MTNKGGQPNNINALKSNMPRVHWHGTVAQETRTAIRRLAADLGLSQSEVVDMWRKFWEENHIETAKEDKENVRN